MAGNIALEVAVFSGSNAVMAQRHGASRVELNAPGSYADGGLTPAVSELTSVASQLTIPVRVMIRPVGKPLARSEEGGLDFMYSAEEFEQMKSSIAEFKESGVMNPMRGDGFVFGIVKPMTTTGEIDAEIDDQEHAGVCVDNERCSVLTQLARPFPCVFHRAFDSIASSGRVDEGINDLIECKFDGLLTSGGPGSHIEYLPTLDKLITRFSGHLQIIVGGGIRSHNVATATSILGTHVDKTVWFHSACLTFKSDHPEEDIDTDELGVILGVMEVTERI